MVDLLLVLLGQISQVRIFVLQSFFKLLLQVVFILSQQSVLSYNLLILLSQHLDFSQLTLHAISFLSENLSIIFHLDDVGFYFIMLPFRGFKFSFQFNFLLLQLFYYCFHLLQLNFPFIILGLQSSLMFVVLRLRHFFKLIDQPLLSLYSFFFYSQFPFFLIDDFDFESQFLL